MVEKCVEKKRMEGVKIKDSANPMEKIMFTVLEKTKFGLSARKSVSRMPSMLINLSWRS